MIDLDIRKAELALASRDIAALSRELAVLFPSDPDSRRAEDLVRTAFGERPPGFEPRAESSVFFDSIERTRNLLASGRFDSTLESRMEIGTDLDFIGGSEGIGGWTLSQCLNYLMLGAIRPTRRAAVVGTMRDDGLYVLEWIAHYLSLGFEHIFIYTNDNSDGSDRLLRLLSDARIITLIESRTTGKVAPEGKAYEHSIQLLHELRQFEWVLYVDSDEFFIPAPRFQNNVGNVIAALGERFPRRPPSGICYAWRWFISSMTYARAPGLLIERFQHARSHWITKALVRLQDVVSMRHGHFPDVRPGGVLVDSAFGTVPLDVRELWSERRPQYEGGWINHYWPKSFEEFAIKKARGQTLDLEENTYDRPFKMFFAWNGYAAEDNHFPINPVLLDSVKKTIEKLRNIAGVGELADQIDREFPVLLDHYYGEQKPLPGLFLKHKIAPTEL